ncbi:MAG: hypothetical protein HQK54_02955 [Oligoflexales bacterium]|nr:hypothetical protein [Oligoflexales bacterium]
MVEDGSMWEWSSRFISSIFGKLKKFFITDSLSSEEIQMPQISEKPNASDENLVNLKEFKIRKEVDQICKKYEGLGITFTKDMKEALYNGLNKLQD